MFAADAGCNEIAGGARVVLEDGLGSGGQAGGCTRRPDHGVAPSLPRIGLGKADEHRIRAVGLSPSVRLEIKVAPGCHRGCWCQPLSGCVCHRPALGTSDTGNEHRASAESHQGRRVGPQVRRWGSDFGLAVTVIRSNQVPQSCGLGWVRNWVGTGLCTRRET
jgi:hypothetical protein